MILMMSSMTILDINAYHVVLGGEVLDAPVGAADDTDETGDGMLHAGVLVVEQGNDELELLVLADEEDVLVDQLVDQVLPELGRDLQRVDPEGQEHLHHAVDVLLRVAVQQLVLVLEDHRLAYQLTP